MSLPPGFLDELRSRTSLAQVVGRKVAWDMRKSNQGRGDMWAPCPFHQEKTASFHVEDAKGFYYCFGCHAKGDAISFVRETENVGFMEAVEILAREAGMTMPARDPKAQEKADRRSLLADVMEQAVQHYRLQLSTGAAAEARAYLDRRGLSQEAQARWEIGFAPDTRQGLFQHLTAKGVAAEMVIDAGLAAKPDDGGAPYDRFRGRIVFPIRDARGRAIALGGRAMDPGARAKYLNSPETALFDKGRSLYNHKPAREAAGKGQPLIVAEGYMDVIALSEAGFAATVAPLGTAVTEDQLQLLWRIAEEPIIALDGDTAGLRAAMRLMELALPMLGAGRSLRFCLMPEGQDPDDVIRAGGAAAMQKLIDAAEPPVALLWRRETEGKVFDSPERRVALEAALRQAVQRIQDDALRRHYTEEFNSRRWALFRGKPKAAGQAKRGQWRDWRAPEGATPAARGSFLAMAGASVEDQLHEAVVLAVLIAHPDLLAQFEGPLERLQCRVPEHRAIQAALLALDPQAPGAVRDEIAARAGADALEKLHAASHLRIVPALRPESDGEQAAMCVAEALAKLEAQRGLDAEVAEAADTLGALADEWVTQRLGEAAEAHNRAQKSETEDRAEYDLGPNGARIRREEKAAFATLLEQIEFSRGSRHGES